MQVDVLERRWGGEVELERRSRASSIFWSTYQFEVLESLVGREAAELYFASAGGLEVVMEGMVEIEREGVELASHRRRRTSFERGF